MNQATSTLICFGFASSGFGTEVKPKFQATGPFPRAELGGEQMELVVPIVDLPE